jgi:hypothetical protein
MRAYSREANHRRKLKRIQHIMKYKHYSTYNKNKYANAKYAQIYEMKC